MKRGIQAAAGTTVMVSATSPDVKSSNETLERPNILHFTVHDLGSDLGCYGHPNVRTPNLNRLASEGMRFDNYFCCSTPCSPSRGCAMTGRYAHSNGLIGLTNRGINLPESEQTIVDYLNSAGYETWNIGHQHERHDRRTNRYQHLGDGSHWIKDVAGHVSDFLKGRKPGDAPFYLNAATFEVHAPWNDKPEYKGRHSPESIAVPAFLPDVPIMRQMLSDYYGCVDYMDEQFGRVLAALAETGLDQNTLVIFTTDHGISFPRAKSSVYDPGLRIALIVRWPGRIKSGCVCKHLTSNIDMCPTLVEIAGGEVADRVHGKSFAPVLTGDAYIPNKEIFAERNLHEDFDPIRTVRTAKHKYIRNYSERCSNYQPQEAGRIKSFHELWLGNPNKERPYEELYDLENDPGEFVNVAQDAAYASLLEDLSGLLDTWMDNTQDFMRGGYEFAHYPARDKRLIGKRRG